MRSARRGNGASHRAAVYLSNNLQDARDATEKLAVLGICFGGRYAHLAAARYGIDAAASYHGTYIERHLDETHKITCPVSFHFGETDPVTRMDQVRAIQDSYAGHRNAEIVAHPNAVHNFSMPHKDAYDPVVAKVSRDAVLRCFQSM